jgi:uncharacterized protein (DUF1330 family)
MPKGYVIFTEAIHDQEAMGTYSQAAFPTIMDVGSNVLVASQGAEVLEGEWHGNQTVVLEFESVEAAKAWYESDDYQAAVPLRQAAADCNVAILPGFG